MKTKLVHATLAVTAAAGFAVMFTLTSARAEAPSAEHSHDTAAHAPHWTYEGDTGPAHWAELDPAFVLCKDGKAQSPVDLTTANAATGGPVNIEANTTSLRIAKHEHVESLVDNGHTIQVTVKEGSTFTSSHGIYELKQFHFHAPSEHTIDGRSFPLEVHFVHQSPDGHVAVVGMFFVEGAPDENLAKLIAHLPASSGQSAHLTADMIDLDLHLPADRTAYTYMGSLTTPPCTEGVEWYVLREPLTASREQLAAFAAHLKNNHRPVQALNGRPIEAVKIASKDGT